MSDLQMIFQALDRLQPDEIEQVRQYLDQRQTPPAVPSNEAIEAKIAALRAATENFWEGYTPEEVDEIVAAMNSEYVNPKDLELFAWLDDIPEDER